MTWEKMDPFVQCLVAFGGPSLILCVCFVVAPLIQVACRAVVASVDDIQGSHLALSVGAGIAGAHWGAAVLLTSHGKPVHESLACAHGVCVAQMIATGCALRGEMNGLVALECAAAAFACTLTPFVLLKQRNVSWRVTVATVAVLGAIGTFGMLWIVQEFELHFDRDMRRRIENDINLPLVGATSTFVAIVGLFAIYRVLACKPIAPKSK